MSFEQAIRSLLAADSSLTLMLPTYQGQPAIFRGQLAPDDAPYPFLIVRYVSEVDVETFREEGARTLIDVAIYNLVENGGDALANITDRAVSLLKRAQPSPPGYGQSTCKLESVVSSPYESGVIGRVATFECRGLISE